MSGAIMQHYGARTAGNFFAAASLRYTGPELARLYDFPAEVDGTGQTVAIIQLGGGFFQDDLTVYFAELGLAVPDITTICVDGGQNLPIGGFSRADREVTLDIQVLGSMAPGAKIVVYFAPNSDRGFLDAIGAAVHDATHRPTIIAITWCGPESGWSAQYLQAFNEVFAAAAAMGITVCVASGDYGSDATMRDGRPHVYFPSSSPYVLACGGTQMVVQDGSIIDEVAWNDGIQASGGGVSVAFNLPDWQVHAGVPAPLDIPSSAPGLGKGRGVPDVAANAVGYRFRVHGSEEIASGTSPVTLLWAALVARLNQALGKPVGFLNPALYRLPPCADALHDILKGGNGHYSAGPGWDSCTGLGSPAGSALLQALRATPPTRSHG